MRLDRNTNKDGAGKYGLVKMRALNALDPTTQQDAISAIQLLIALHVVEITPETPGDQFFVMRYKDVFTCKGLEGYADGIKGELDSLHDQIDQLPLDIENEPERDRLIALRDSLIEYEQEIRMESIKANEGTRIPD